MRPGFIEPYRKPHRYTANLPLFMDGGKVMMRNPVDRYNQNKKNGQASGLTISPSESSQDKKVSENPVPKVPVDISKDVFTIGELVSLDVENIPFLLEGLIPKEAITFLAGSSDVGKSLFYSDLALRLITDQKTFIGKKIHTTYGKVLLISTEDGPVAISSRIKKQLKGQQLTTKQKERMKVLTSSANLFFRVKEILRTYSVDLIILDAFGDVFDGDINTSNRVRLFLNDFAELVKKHNSSMLIVHHIGKGKEATPASKNHLLGSVGIEGKARQVLMLSKNTAEPEMRKLRIVKGNYVSEVEKKKTYGLAFNPESLTYSEEVVIVADIREENASRKPGVKVDPQQLEEAAKLKKEGLKNAEIAKRLGKHPSTISRWLREVN